MNDRTYDRFLGAWVGAMLGGALGRFTSGRSPRQVEESYPRGLRGLDPSPAPRSRALDESEAFAARTFPAPAGRMRSPLDPVVGALAVGLASVPAALYDGEVDEHVAVSLAKWNEPLPPHTVVCALWFARLVRRAVLGTDGEIDASLYDPLDAIGHPVLPGIVDHGQHATSKEAWSEAKTDIAHGIGAGVATLDRLDLHEGDDEPGVLAAGVAAWAAVTDDRLERALEKVVGRGGDSLSYGTIGGAIVGARLGFSGFPEALLSGLASLPDHVERGARLWRASEDYRGVEVV